MQPIGNRIHFLGAYHIQTRREYCMSIEDFLCSEDDRENENKVNKSSTTSLAKFSAIFENCRNVCLMPCCGFFGTCGNWGASFFYALFMIRVCTSDEDETYFLYTSLLTVVLNDVICDVVKRRYLRNTPTYLKVKWQY